MSKYIILLLALLSATVFAQSLTVVADYGQTEPLATTMPSKQDLAKLKRLVNNPQAMREFTQYAMNQAMRAKYHVSTPSMTVGKVVTRKIAHDQDLFPQMVVVGCDKVSMRWLRHYKSRFTKLNLMGVVVNCLDKAAFDQLQKIAGIKLVPMNGSLITRVFHETHYPFIYSHNMITQ